MTIPGTTVSTDVEVTNFARLGKYVGDQNARDQADLLTGLAFSVRGEGDGDGDLTGLMQIQYIGEAIDAFPDRDDADAVRWFVSELHARINPEQVTA